MEDAELGKIIKQIAAMDLGMETMRAAGAVSEADFKAYEAKSAELIQALDEIRGTADVTYEQFREAFDKGADCASLFDLKNRMHPHDDLKKAANEDLRSVGCYMKSAHRTDRGESTHG